MHAVLSYYIKGFSGDDFFPFFVPVFFSVFSVIQLPNPRLAFHNVPSINLSFIAEQLRRQEGQSSSQSLVLLRSLNDSDNDFDVFELPILKSSKFLVIDGSKEATKESETSSFSSDIQHGSAYGQALLATIYGLSI